MSIQAGMKRDGMTGKSGCWGLLVAMALAGGPAQAEGWRVSLTGYGPVRIGMPVVDAARLLGVTLTVPEDARPDCHYLNEQPDLPGVDIMASHGRIVRFEVGEPSTIAAMDDLGLGAPEARVLSVLGAEATVQPHHYEGPVANYVTLLTPDAQSGVRFETVDGIVTRFHVGRTPEVTFVEGCE